MAGQHERSFSSFLLSSFCKAIFWLIYYVLKEKLTPVLPLDTRCRDQGMDTT